MKIIDIIKGNKPSLSFEVFPPKTHDKYDSVSSAIKEIALLNPSYMSVTYGAGGGTSEYTAKIASEVSSLGVNSLAHLSCISSSKELVREQIAKLDLLGIENILALRGDYPKDPLFDKDHLEFHYAKELNEFIHKEFPETFCLSGACYPEVHLEASCFEDDLKALKEKVDAGASYLVTQIFFDNSYYYRLVKEARKRGITVPILAGYDVNDTINSCGPLGIFFVFL